MGRHGSRRSAASGPPAALLLLLLLLLDGTAAADPPRGAGAGGFTEIARFDAPAARQGVAVDARHFYAIDERRIEKYDRQGGEPVAVWDGNASILHLNSGIVIDGVLYCAHSNYPDVPMTSSIEWFDAETLEPLGSHSFGIAEGSATWVDRAHGRWWVAFATYTGRGGEPGRDARWTSLVAFDDAWRRLDDYVFPAEVLEAFAGRSNSGGAWSGDGLLYVTGTDAPEVYALRLPPHGSVLELVRREPAPIAGQGIAWDPAEPGVLWGIVKRDRRVVVSRRRGAPE